MRRRALKDDRMGHLLVEKGGVALCHTAQPNSMISSQHVSDDEGNDVKRLLKTGPKGV